MNALTLQILKSAFLLQLRILARDHVTGLTPWVISSSPSSSYASISSSFHLFLPFGVADRQTQRDADGHDARRIQRQGPRVAAANMRAGCAQQKQLLIIKNVARQDASLYGLDRNPIAPQQTNAKYMATYTGTMTVSHYTDVHRSKLHIARIRACVRVRACVRACEGACACVRA